MMNRLLSALSAVCAEHPLVKKYLIVPSYQIGRQLGDALAAGGSSWVNLHSVTLPALAEQAAGPELAANGTRVISGAEALSLVDQVFGQLKDAGRLDYFGRVEATAGTIGAIQKSIFTLRMAGLKSAALDPASFIDDKKGREFALLLRSYEQELEKGRLVDLPGVYELALKSVAARPKSRTGANAPSQERELFIVFREQPLGAVERRFLLEIAGDRLTLVPQDPVFGLVRPRRLWDSKTFPAADSPDTGAPLFSWLFDARKVPRPPSEPSCAPPAGSQAIDIFSAVGPTNECREIVRRLLDVKVPFDDVEIIHPPDATFPSIMYSLAAKTGFSLTLADGVPIAFTAPGKVFSGLIDWLKHDYFVSDLCALIESGAIALPKRDGLPPLSPLKASRYLKSAMIGWGKTDTPNASGGFSRTPTKAPAVPPAWMTSSGGPPPPPKPTPRSGASSLPSKRPWRFSPGIPKTTRWISRRSAGAPAPS